MRRNGLMKPFKYIFTLSLALILLCVAEFAACAHAVPDFEATGSVTVTMHCGNTVVSGGTVTLYRVGKVYEQDGNYSFIPVDDFADCGEDFHEVQSSDLAGKLRDYAEEHEITGTTKSVSSDGTAVFADLELGLYLLVQHDAAEGYNKAVPFLMGVPNIQAGEYVYDVNAAPKVELEKEVESVPPTPATPTDPKLPQTGQLNWPIPVLVTLGLMLFSCGWLLRFGRKRTRNEK